MGEFLFVLDCCGEVWSDYWGDYTYCEGCGAVNCDTCLDELEYEKDEDSDELWECPRCDQFRHMNANYCP